MTIDVSNVFCSLVHLFRCTSGTAVTPSSAVSVPDAPERVKAVISNEDAVVISWLPPRRPNGILTKYTVYVRVLDQGQEVKITKSSLPAQNLHHEATGLKLRESYEAWVTASTKMGQGPSTPVIKLQLSNTGKPSYDERETFPLPAARNVSSFQPYPRLFLSLPSLSLSLFFFFFLSFPGGIELNNSIRERSWRTRGKWGQ